MVNGGVKLGLFGKLVKTLAHADLVLNCLVEAECVNAKFKDVF